jgi:hypothetical protein
MTNVTLQALFERDYKEAGIEIPAWTQEQLHIFEGAETAISIGCELEWKANNPVSSWPAPDDMSVDPRTFEYSGAEMKDLALAMIYDANIPLILPDYE